MLLGSVSGFSFIFYNYFVIIFSNIFLLICHVSGVYSDFHEATQNICIHICNIILHMAYIQNCIIQSYGFV